MVGLISTTAENDREVRLLDRLELGLVERLPVHLGDEAAGHLLLHVIGEVELDHAPRHLPLAETGQPRLALHAVEGLLPGGANHFRRLLHLEAPLAGSYLLDSDFHRDSWLRDGARGGS
jgi:hypothetical protein